MLDLSKQIAQQVELTFQVTALTSIQIKWGFCENEHSDLKSLGWDPDSTFQINFHMMLMLLIY